LRLRLIALALQLSVLKGALQNLAAITMWDVNSRCGELENFTRIAADATLSRSRCIAVLQIID
jgi:hypothetical protein